MTSPQPQNNPQQMQTAADDQSPAVAAAAMHFKREICDKVSFISHHIYF